jgi:hypothetical protein
MKLTINAVRSWLLISSVLSLSCSGQFNTTTTTTSPTLPEQSVERLYQGSLNDRIPIKVSLRIDGDTIVGTYVYTKYGRDIPIRGTIDAQRRFLIKEYGGKGGTHTGTFEGNLVSDSELKGTWSDPTGQKVMGFLLRERQSVPASVAESGGTPPARPATPLLAAPEDHPTEAHARSVFEKLTRAIPIWGGRPLTLTVLSFRKTDGQARMESGVKHYRIFFEAEVQCPRNDYVNMLDVPINIGIHGSHRQGRERIKGFVVFERTERGWKGQDRTVY